MTPESIFKNGLEEVSRIKIQMASIIEEVQFKGSLLILLLF